MEQSKIKKVLLTALLMLVLVMACGFATLTYTSASTTDAKADAEATAVFTDKTIIAAGASVRVEYSEDDQEEQIYNGIRFATYLQNVTKEEIASSYALIIPHDLLDGTSDLTELTAGVLKEWTTTKWHTYTDEQLGEVLCSYVVLYNVDLASYTRDITVETVVELKDGTILSTDYRTEGYKGTRSLDWVAEQAIAANQFADDANRRAILEAYNVENKEEGTFADFEDVTLSATNTTAQINDKPSFWTNYYKGYNTLSFGVTVNGSVSDVTSLKYVLSDGSSLNLPLGGLVAGKSKQVPVDYDFTTDYSNFAGGHFEATVTGDTTVTVAPMTASTVENVVVEDLYLYSVLKSKVNVNDIAELKKDGVTADDILYVTSNGADVQYAASGDVFTISGNDVLNATTKQETGKDDTKQTVVLQTATKKYTMTWLPCTDVFREVDDLYVERGGNWYSYFDYYSVATSANNYAVAITGYYAVANDIIVPETETRAMRQQNASRVYGYTSVNKFTSSQRVGFVGTFDGRGNTIDGVTVGKYGIFAHIGAKAVVQNLALTNIRFKAENYRMIFANFMVADLYGASIQFVNVYMSLHEEVANMAEDIQDYYNLRDCAVLSAYMKNISFTNVVMDFSAYDQKIAYAGALCANYSTDVNTWGGSYRNVYVISKTPLLATKEIIVDAPNRIEEYGAATPVEVWGADSADKDGDGNKEEMVTFDVSTFYEILHRSDGYGTIYRYDTMTDFVAAVESGLYVPNNDYFEVVDNLLVWKNAK